MAYAGFNSIKITITNMTTNFLDLSVEDRKEYIAKLIKKNPKSIPVVLMVDKKSSIPELNKKRLVPKF